MGVSRYLTFPRRYHDSRIISSKCAVYYSHPPTSEGWLKPNRSLAVDGLSKLRRALFRRLVRRGALPQDAEDAIHEAFVRLYRAQKKELVRNPAAFVTDVVMKVRIEHWRSAQRRGRLFSEEAVEELEVVDLSPLPEEYLQAEQRLERMWRRLGELSPRTR